MNDQRTWILGTAYLMLCPFILFGAELVNLDSMTTVQTVDLNRYTGLWHEIAKIPNRFQKQCVGKTTAQYTLRTDGKIKVVNRCLRSDGDYAEVRGIAKLADTLSNAKLKVSFVRLFGISLFWGDYWIIGLDSDYQWAIVGEPSRKYGWVLAREPVLSDTTWKVIQYQLTDKGYDPQKFVKTVQN